MKGMKSDLIGGLSAKFYKMKASIMGLNKIHEKVISSIHLKKDELLLDVGSGTGKVLFAISSKIKTPETLFGVDGSPDMIKIAEAVNERRGKPIKFKIAYADDLPFEDNKFDVVLSTLTLHHIPPDDKPRVVKEMFRVLKPGGRLIITDFGRPRGLHGRIISFLSRAHSYTKDNMDIFHAEIDRLGFVVESNDWQYGYVEHVIARKPISL
jgi:ubiquinone/menaquinone biosynthesis C-methylase UbiE